MWLVVQQLLGAAAPSTVIPHQSVTDQTHGWRIVKEMFRHIWPQDQPSLKMRVVLALGLLGGAKVHITV